MAWVSAADPDLQEQPFYFRLRVSGVSHRSASCSFKLFFIHLFWFSPICLIPLYTDQNNCLKLLSPWPETGVWFSVEPWEHSTSVAEELSWPAAEDPVVDLGQFVRYSVCNVGSGRQERGFNGFNGFTGRPLYADGWTHTCLTLWWSENLLRSQLLHRTPQPWWWSDGQTDIISTWIQGVGKYY